MKFDQLQWERWRHVNNWNQELFHQLLNGYYCKVRTGLLNEQHQKPPSKKVIWGCPRKPLRKQTLIVWSRKLRGSRINLPSIRFPETVVAEAARKTARKTSRIRREWHRGFRHRSNDVPQNYPMFVIFNGLRRPFFLRNTQMSCREYCETSCRTECVECRECSWSEQIITTSQQSHCRWWLVRYPTRGLQSGH